MKNLIASFALLFSFSSWAIPVGKTAPDFNVKDSHGKTQALSAYKGKTVILEWHNQGCPFVKKHYESGNMQKLQKNLTEKGFVWLTVISSAPGKQGAVTPNEANEYVKKMKAAPTAVLLDADGKMGQAYGAKTTPHIFIINPEGNLVYNGAIDDHASTDAEDIASSKNYILQAADDIAAGKPLQVSTTQPYGCSVKY